MYDIQEKESQGQDHNWKKYLIFVTLSYFGMRMCIFKIIDTYVNQFETFVFDRDTCKTK